MIFENLRFTLPCRVTRLNNRDWVLHHGRLSCCGTITCYDNTGSFLCCLSFVVDCTNVVLKTCTKSPLVSVRAPKKEKIQSSSFWISKVSGWWRVSQSVCWWESGCQRVEWPTQRSARAIRTQYMHLSLVSASDSNSSSTCISSRYCSVKCWHPNSLVIVLAAPNDVCAVARDDDGIISIDLC